MYTQFLQLLYVDSLKFDQVNVPRKRPAICYWSSEKIRFREECEQEEGKFGLGEFNKNEEVEEESEEEDSEDTKNYSVEVNLYYVCIHI